MLERFLESIEIAGIPLGDNYKAWRMDGSTSDSHMRNEVELGSCDCCDYFTIRGNIVFLIEETELLARFSHYKRQYNFFPNEEEQNEFILAKIREKNRMKAYGSLLVLCRLAARDETVRAALQTKKYRFWLVIGDMESEQGMVLEWFTTKLKNDLKSMLTGHILDDLQIIPPSSLKNNL